MNYLTHTRMTTKVVAMFEISFLVIVTPDYDPESKFTFSADF